MLLFPNFLGDWRFLRPFDLPNQVWRACRDACSLEFVAPRKCYEEESFYQSHDI